MDIIKKAKFIAPIIAAGFPLIAFAETRTFKDLVGVIATYLDEALLLLMGFAIVMFVWYVIRYFIMENDKRTEAAQYIMWSLTGFFVILSMWGLVNILVSTFNLHQGNVGSWSSLESIFPSGGQTFKTPDNVI